MAFSDISNLIRASFVVTLTAFIFHIIGFSTNYWLEYDYGNRYRYYNKYNKGLWRECVASNTTSDCEAIRMSGLTVELKTTRAFETMGLMVGVASFVLICLTICVRQKRIIRYLSAAASFGAGILIFIGVIVFATDRPYAYEFGYSFALAIVGGIFYVISGVIMGAEIQSQPAATN